MDKLITNAGLHHLADHIFGFVDTYSLTQCMLVCKDWNHFLSRTILVRHFDKLLTLQRRYKTNDGFEFCLRLSPDWTEAAHFFRQICSDEDLKEVIRVLNEWFYKSSYCYCPLEHAASQGYEDFFKVILKTSIDLNKGGSDLKLKSAHPPIFNACYYGQINIVKMLLNAKENGGMTGCIAPYDPEVYDHHLHNGAPHRMCQSMIKQRAGRSSGWHPQPPGTCGRHMQASSENSSRARDLKPLGVATRSPTAGVRGPDTGPSLT